MTSSSTHRLRNRGIKRTPQYQPSSARLSSSGTGHHTGPMLGRKPPHTQTNRTKLRNESTTRRLETCARTHRHVYITRRHEATWGHQRTKRSSVRHLRCQMPGQTYHSETQRREIQPSCTGDIPSLQDTRFADDRGGQEYNTCAATRLGRTTLEQLSRKSFTHSGNIWDRPTKKDREQRQCKTVGTYVPKKVCCAAAQSQNCKGARKK